MNGRGHESPMDFEWQTHAPADVTSPFHKLAMEHHQNEKKRPLSVFESPNKPAPPVLREPNSQPFLFSQIPPLPKPPASPYRAPSFTTPRKPLEVEFSSGPENVSSPEQADNEDTPEAPRTAAVTFTANESKPVGKRNSLFGLYGRFAPNSGRADISKAGHSNALIRRVQKRRRREQNLGRQLMRTQRASAESSEDESPVKESKNTVPPVHEVGYMAGLFTFIESFPNAPSLLAKYLQLFFNSAIILGCLYAIYSFWTTIQADVNRASEEAAAETLAEMAACAKSYVDNRCGADSRLPALETVCSNWELCMNRDPNSVKRAKLSAHTFAEILNSFVEPISLKTMMLLPALAISLAVINVTFPRFHRPSKPAPVFATSFDSVPTHSTRATCTQSLYPSTTHEDD